MGEPKLEYYQRADGRWAWALHAGNGQIVATDHGQGYENQGDCVDMAQQVVGGVFAGARQVFA